MLEVLLADDEPAIRKVLSETLREAGFQVTPAADGEEARQLVASRVFDVLVTDMKMPKLDGMSLFRHVRAQSPSTDVILMTGYGDIGDAVSALKEGANDYLTKPLDAEELVVRIRRLADRRQIASDLAKARAELSSRRPDPGILGSSPAMARLLERIDAVASSDAPVLVTGESGTGKELVARRLHDLSGRKDKPFVAVNCAAFPETLIEAELFGHERGAFTGAVRRRDGRFKAADGGTLFLDEVAEIPLPIQAKLLRVLQEGVVEALGTDAPAKVDVRLISATHRNLKERISAGLFREDLFYRINVLDLAIPPLRERRSDVPLLVQHFLKVFGRSGSPIPGLTPRAWAALSEYPFPGNVRELQHAIERACVLSRGAEIDLEHLPPDIAGVARPATDPNGGLRPLSAAADEFEKEYMLRALRLSGGKKQKAADLLGISRKSLWEKLRDHGVQETDDDA